MNTTPSFKSLTTPYSLGKVNFDASLNAVREELASDHVPEPLNGGHYIDGLGGRVHYRAYMPQSHTMGTIIGLHGATHNSGFYHDIGVQASLAGYKFYALDMPGHGDSYHRPDGNYTYDNLTDEIQHCIEQIIPATDRGQLCKIGSSLGGQAFMVLSERIAGAATVLNDIGPLISAQVHYLVIKNFEDDKAHSLDDMITTAGKRYMAYGMTESAGTTEFIRASLESRTNGDEKLYRYKLDKNFGSIYRNVAVNPQYADDKPAHHRDHGIKGSDLTKQFKKIKEPILMLHGQESRFFNLQQLENCFAGNVEQIISVEKAGHPVALSNQGLNTQIIQFLNEKLEAV